MSKLTSSFQSMAKPPALRTHGTTRKLSYLKSAWIFLISSIVCFVSIRNKTLGACSLTKWESILLVRWFAGPCNSNSWFSLCSVGLDLSLHHFAWLISWWTLCFFPFLVIVFFFLSPVTPSFFSHGHLPYFIQASQFFFLFVSVSRVFLFFSTAVPQLFSCFCYHVWSHVTH